MTKWVIRDEDGRESKPFDSREEAADEAADMELLELDVEVIPKEETSTDGGKVEVDNAEVIEMSGGDGGNENGQDDDSDEDSKRKWSDVDVSVEQAQGAIRMEMFGDADMAVYPPSQTAPETDPYLPISVHYPTELDESDEVADIRVSLSPETARELGEWLCEHADDEPDVVLDGDVDE